MKIVDVEEFSSRVSHHYAELYAKIDAQPAGKAAVFDNTECPRGPFCRCATTYFRVRYGNGVFHYRMLPGGEIAAWLTKDVHSHAQEKADANAAR